MLVGLTSKVFLENVSRIELLGPYVIWNFSSYYMGVDKVNLLPNVNQANIMDERMFDIQYFESIMNNDALFFEMFHKIIYPLYSGMNVFLLIDRAPLYDSILESIFKILQDRYGYNCSYIINEIDDIDSLDDSSVFNSFGVFYLSQDKERYAAMYANIHAKEIAEENAKGWIQDV